MASIGQGVGQNPMLQWLRLQNILQPQQTMGPQNPGGMNPSPGPQSPFTQPMGTTLNSIGSPALRPQPTPGQINPPQGSAAGGIQNPLTGNAMNMGNIQKGLQGIAQGLHPQGAPMQSMSVPNLQLHQPGAGANPQMLQQMLMSGRYGSPGGGGPFGDTQGGSYA